MISFIISFVKGSWSIKPSSNKTLMINDKEEYCYLRFGHQIPVIGYRPCATVFWLKDFIEDTSVLSTAKVLNLYSKHLNVRMT